MGFVMGAFVDLSLKMLGKEDCISFCDAVKASDIAVILGAPGCGKTTLLKHFADYNASESKFLRVQHFLIIDEDLSCFKYVLLDGFDELKIRNGSSSESIYKIASKIKRIRDKYSDITFVLSCREIDWYGDDSTALKECCGTNSVNVYNVQPLNYGQKNQLVEQLIKDNFLKENFWQGFCRYEILDNPQILTMFIETFLSNPQSSFRSKRDVYERFIKSAKERNPSHKKLNDFVISPDEMFKYGGYLAYCSLLSGIHNLDDDFLENIADSNLFPLSKLKLITETNLFKSSNELCFAHRTIAEFLCAHFLFYEKYQKDYFPLNRIASLLLARNGTKVLPEFRGIFAWLCSFSGDKELIECDPYGQLLYGDNSIYPDEVKEIVLSAIHKYAEKNPYFMHYSHELSPKSFYTPNLDAFLIKEYRNCWDKPNHYLFLLGDLIGCSKNNSPDITQLAIEVLRKEKLGVHFKKQFVPLLSKDVGVLKDILLDVEEEKIEDKKSDLLDAIIRELYPKEIKPSEIIRHLKKYKDKNELFNHYEYLENDISYDEMKLLVKDLYDNFTEGLHHDSSFHYVAQHFVSKFFEKALKNEYSKDFLAILLEFNEKEISFTENSWADSKEKIENVDNASKESLLEEYLKLIVPKKEDEEHSCWITECNLRYYIESLLPPSYLNLLEIKIDLGQSKITNFTYLRLIYSGMRSCKDLAGFANEKCSGLASKYGLDDLWQEYIAESPAMRKIRERQEKWDRERQERLQKSIEENEAGFKKIPTEEKKNVWNYFFHVSSYFLRKEAFEENTVALHEDTYNKILHLIKEWIFELDKSPFKEELSLDTLIEKHLGNHTNFTEFICTSLILNEIDEYEKIAQKSYIDYLYITALSYKDFVELKKIEFIDWFEATHKQNAYKILWDYVNLILKKGLLEKYDTVKKIFEGVINNLPEEKRSKQIHELYQYQLTSNVVESSKKIIGQFVEKFAFVIKPSDYESLKGFCESTDAKLLILEKFNDNPCPIFDLNESIALFELLRPNHDLSFMDADARFKTANIFLNSFNSEELLEHPSGIQTVRDNCAWFVDHSLFNQMDGDIWLNVLNRLLIEHQDDFWTNRLKNKHFELQESLYGDDSPAFSVEKVKSFVLNKGCTSARDFWIDLISKVSFVKTDIEHNLNNQKRAFWGKNDDPKIENDCRDVILVRLNDLYKSVLNATREVYVANDKRVDISVKCRQDESFVVQIECKKDDNAGLFDGIKNQLVEQYLFKNVVEYGIYLVFCFKNDPEKLEKDLLKTIPQGYEEKIKIICINLKL